MIRGGFLRPEGRAELIDLARDGSLPIDCDAVQTPFYCWTKGGVAHKSPKPCFLTMTQYVAGIGYIKRTAFWA